MSESATLIPERLEAAMEAPLLAGGHNPPTSADAPPAKACFNEMVSWINGEPWSASPKCVSPVLISYSIRLNDRLPDADRQRLTAFLERVSGTAGDGQDDARRALAAKWVINTSLPQWLELVGLTARADELRTMEVSKWTPALRDLLWKVRDEIREETGVTWLGFRRTIRVEVRKRLEEKGTPVAVADAAAAAVAVADAAAAAAAAAATAAAADAAAVAVAVADAVAVAVADAVADAVAVADAAADADLDPHASWQKVYDTVRNSDEVKAAIDKAIPFAAEHREAAFELFEQMIDPSAAE